MLEKVLIIFPHHINILNFYINKYMCDCAHVNILCVCACDLNVHIYTVGMYPNLDGFMYLFNPKTYMCMYICVSSVVIDMWMYSICIYTHVHMCMCVYGYIYIYVYVCV